MSYTIQDLIKDVSSVLEPHFAENSQAIRHVCRARLKLEGVESPSISGRIIAAIQINLRAKGE